MLHDRTCCDPEHMAQRVPLWAVPGHKTDLLWLRSPNSSLALIGGHLCAPCAAPTLACGTGVGGGVTLGMEEVAVARAAPSPDAHGHMASWKMPQMRAEPTPVGVPGC